MPKIQDYECVNCGNLFEFMTMTSDEIVDCPECRSGMVEVILSGGTVFKTIVPSYIGSVKNKAGSCHRFWNRPAEKISVSVPKGK